MFSKKNNIICLSCGQKSIEKAKFCHRCGVEINENNPGNSVQELSADIIEINKNTKHRGFWGRLICKVSFWLKGNCSLDSADKKIVALVNNFIIPENVDEIYEFMLLCESNISYCRKRSLLENSAEEYINKTIHDVWEAKFMQAYQRVQEMHMQDPKYDLIEQLYNRLENENAQYVAGSMKAPGIIFIVIVIISVVGYFVLAVAQIMGWIG